MRSPLLAILALVTLAGCAGASDDAATSGSALEGDAAGGKLSCGVDYTRPECLAAPDGCTVGLGGQDVPVGDEFPTMSTTFGATAESPYRVDVVVRPYGGGGGFGRAELLVTDNRTGAEVQTVTGEFSIATLGPRATSMVTAKITVPEFTYQGKPFTQLHLGCTAWVPSR